MQNRLAILFSLVGLAIGAIAVLAATGKLDLAALIEKPQANLAPATPPLDSRPVPPSGDDAAYTAFDQGQYLTALNLARAAAEKGDVQSHSLVARIYDEGLGVAKDEATAAKWYGRAADLGDVPAMIAYGNMLANGRGVAKDKRKAGEYYEKAAMTGNPVANYNLGLLFLSGDGKPENPYRAAKHIAYAAEKGIAAAQYDLAALYIAGTGVPNDALEAARWSAKAAEQGLPAAQYDYAVMLLQGRGLIADEGKVMGYLTAAAEAGIAGAQNRLANVYADGIPGTEQNPKEAAKWRLIAKAGGVADDKLDLFVAALSDADRASAEKEANLWREKSLLMQVPSPAAQPAAASPPLRSTTP